MQLRNSWSKKSGRRKKEQNASQKDLDDLHKKFDDHYEDRMDRIERKLNQLTDAVVSIARAEEKIAVLIEDTREIKESLNDNMERIRHLEVDNEKNKSALRNLSTFFWTVVSAATTIVVTIVVNQYAL